MGKPIERGVAKDRVIEESQPLVHAAVAGEHEAAAAVALDDELVEITALLGCQAMEAKVVHDEEIRGEVASEGALEAVVDPGLGQVLQERIRASEERRVAGPDGADSQGLSEKGLPTPTEPTKGRARGGRGSQG